MIRIDKVRIRSDYPFMQAAIRIVNLEEIIRTVAYDEFIVMPIIFQPIFKNSFFDFQGGVVNPLKAERIRRFPGRQRIPDTICPIKRKQFIFPGEEATNFPSFIFCARVTPIASNVTVWSWAGWAAAIKSAVAYEEIRPSCKSNSQTRESAHCKSQQRMNSPGPRPLESMLFTSL